MKSKNQVNSNQGFGGLIVMAVCAIAAIVMTHKVNNTRTSNNDYMLEHGAYTIGRIIQYLPSSYGTNVGPTSSIIVCYSVNGKEYTSTYNDYDYPVPYESGPEKGQMFMTMYLPNNLGKCAVLYNYPVHDSSDYKRYMEEFKVSRPKLEREIRRIQP